MSGYQVELVITLIGTDGIAEARRKVRLPIPPFVGMEIYDVIGSGEWPHEVERVSVGLKGEIWCDMGSIDGTDDIDCHAHQCTLAGLLEYLGTGWMLENKREHYKTGLTRPNGST